MSMRRTVRWSLCAASSLFFAFATGEVAGNELPAEPLFQAVVREFESGGDGEEPSSILCGDRFFYVSMEQGGQWAEVDLVTGATDFFETDKHGPLGCSSSGHWIESFSEYLDSVVVRAADDQMKDVFEYDQAVGIWAANADVLFLMRDEKWWGDPGSRMAKESPVSESTPFDVLYLEALDERITTLMDSYGGISVMQMIWQAETDEVLTRTGSGAVVALGFGTSRQIEEISELSLGLPEGNEIALDWNTAHVAIYQVYQNAVLTPLLLIVDRAFLTGGSEGVGKAPIPYLLCPIEGQRAECFMRVWEGPETSDLPHSLLSTRVATPIDLNGSVIGLYRFEDRTACVAIWIGMSNAAPRCLTKDYALSSSRSYNLALNPQPEGIDLIVYDSARPGREYLVDLYRFDYKTLRELGVDG